MNKTLLIIICDFLLISILALVEFKPSEQEPQAQDAVLNQLEPDLVEVLQLSLENESSRNQDLSSRLDTTEQTLSEREQALAETQSAKESLETVRQELETDLSQTRQNLEQTAEERARLASDLDARQRQAERLQAELQERLAALEQAQSSLDEAEQSRSELEQRQQRLETDLQIRETEKNLLEQNLTAARAEVERARIEAERAEKRAEQLSQNVGQLAATSTALTEEFRQAQPLSRNQIFRNFEQNRIAVTGTSRISVLFGTRENPHQLSAVPVTDGSRTYAVFDAASAGLAPDQLERLVGSQLQIQAGEQRFRVLGVSFLREDPRVGLIALSNEIISAANLRPFRLARDPLQFPEAVLINNQTLFYGELPVRVPAGEPDYISVEARFLSRLTGSFTPSSGDFVYAKSGELIGIMVNNNSARILRSLDSSATLNIGDNFNTSEATRIQSQLRR